MPTRNVSLTDELDAAIRARVESGRYENASEVVRDALRALEEREQCHAADLEALRRAFQRGVAELEQGASRTGTAAEHMLRIRAAVRAKSAQKA